MLTLVARGGKSPPLGGIFNGQNNIAHDFGEKDGKFI